jgi:hypothetical protein
MKERKGSLISCDLRSEFIRDSLESLMGDEPGHRDDRLAMGVNTKIRRDLPQRLKTIGLPESLMER